MGFWDAITDLNTGSTILLFVALAVAFGFEFINGFHDTANAVTTVIYTRTLSATPAVIYSGFMNFLGALITVSFGAGVAFGIVNLLPVDLLVNAKSTAALISVLALLLSGVIWNLSTWYVGLPVSSSHTLIGSILGVGLANGLLEGQGLNGVNWDKARTTGIGLLITPLIGFAFGALLLLAMKLVIREKRLYEPPVGDDKPPLWVRAVLIVTCGGVSFAHGSNDGQKGMGLLLLVLVGFMPLHYALDSYNADKVTAVQKCLPELHTLKLHADREKDVAYLTRQLAGATTFKDVPKDDRWEVRQAIFRISQSLKKYDGPHDGEQLDKLRKCFAEPIEYVPLWVVLGTAIALGLGTTVGYKRIVKTVAEKIGKSHLTYGQGAAAEAVTAATIIAADYFHAPVSTTQILSSAVAGTMTANKSGVQRNTVGKILLAWVFTLPCTMLLAGVLFGVGKWLFA